MKTNSLSDRDSVVGVYNSGVVLPGSCPGQVVIVWVVFLCFHHWSL